MTESNRIEYKQELTDKLEKEVIAFLNYQGGGTIYLGIDKSEQVVGIKDSDSDQLKIKDRLKNNIQPSCMGLFEVINEITEGKDVIKITIASGSEKPYYLKKYGMTEKGCFIRVGSASEPMSLKMIEELFSRRIRNSIGKIESHHKDLRFEQLRIYYEERGKKLTNKFASNLDLLTKDGKYNYIAYLLADDNNVSIKVAKYAGTDKCDLIENEEFGFCSLLKATNRVLDKLEVENKTFTKITGAAQRLEKQMINKRALREAFINAVVHNDYTREVNPVVEIYADRLTITSYGGLIEGLSKEEFFEGLSIPRNRELMRIFRDLDFVEHLGSGINRILSSYSQDVFKIRENFLVVTFPFEKEYIDSIKKDTKTVEVGNETTSTEELVERLVEGLVESQQKIVLMIARTPQVSIKKMSELVGISTTAIDKNISALKDKNMIRRVGSDKGGYWEIIDNQ